MRVKTNSLTMTPRAIRNQNLRAMEQKYLEKFTPMRRRELRRLLDEIVKRHGADYQARTLIKKIKASKAGKLSDKEVWALKEELVNYLAHKAMGQAEY